MKRLPIGDIEPGETVARPVTTSGGVVLVQSGTRLTAEILRRLGALGVDAVWLNGSAADARPTAELVGDADRRFAGYEHDELMMQLKAVVLSRIELTGV